MAAAWDDGSKNACLPMFDCPPEIIDALDPDDAERVNEVIRDFFAPSLAAGGRAAPAGGESTSQSSRTF